MNKYQPKWNIHKRWLISLMTSQDASFEQHKKTGHESFSKNSLSQHFCEACGQSLLEPMDIPARRQQTKIQDWILHIHISIFPLFVYKWYAVVTYQPHAHICNSCKRYLVVTYCCIKFTQWNSTYPIRVIPVSWSRLWQNNYGRNWYSFTFRLYIYIIIRYYFHN